MYRLKLIAEISFVLVVAGSWGSMIAVIRELDLWQLVGWMIVNLHLLAVILSSSEVAHERQ